jgi:hypothetical protein
MRRACALPKRTTLTAEYAEDAEKKSLLIEMGCGVIATPVASLAHEVTLSLQCCITFLSGFVFLRVLCVLRGEMSFFGFFYTLPQTLGFDCDRDRD